MTLVIAVSFALFVFSPVWWPEIGADSRDLYAAATLLARGGDPYDPAQQFAQEDRLYNQAPHPHAYAHATYGYPPLFTRALSLASGAGEPAFYLGSLAVLLAASLIAFKLLVDQLGADRHRLTATVFFLAAPPTVLSLFVGNPSPLLLVFWAAAVVLMLRDHNFIAGVAVSLTLIKLPVGLPVSVALLLAGPTTMQDAGVFASSRLTALKAAVRPRAGAVGGFALGAAGLLGLDILLDGLRPLRSWTEALSGYGSALQPGAASSAFAQSGLSGLPALLLGTWGATAATVLACLVVLPLALWGALGLDRGRPHEARLAGIALGVTAALSVSPYLHLNDLMLAALPLLLLARLASSWARFVLVGWFWLVPLRLVGVVILHDLTGYAPNTRSTAGVGVLFTAATLAAVVLLCRHPERLSPGQR